MLFFKFYHYHFIFSGFLSTIVIKKWIFLFCLFYLFLMSLMRWQLIDLYSRKLYFFCSIIPWLFLEPNYWFRISFFSKICFEKKILEYFWQNCQNSYGPLWSYFIFFFSYFNINIICAFFHWFGKYPKLIIALQIILFY